MTFCIAARVREGIIALADTRIVKGGERLSKAKLALHLAPGGSFFTMTSGLRSIRDKLLIYGEEAMSDAKDQFTRLYQVVNLLGEQLRRVHDEDGASLRQANLAFNLHAIVGGRLRDDAMPTLFLVYPEGNWIEINDDSPYFMIGRTPYGRPLLDRHLHADLPLRQASLLALLAFDMTCASVTDVDYPIDMAVMRSGERDFAQRRFEQDQLRSVTEGWYRMMEQALHSASTPWLDAIVEDGGPPDSHADATDLRPQLP